MSPLSPVQLPRWKVTTHSSIWHHGRKAPFNLVFPYVWLKVHVLRDSTVERHVFPNKTKSGGNIFCYTVWLKHILPTNLFSSKTKQYHNLPLFENPPPSPPLKDSSAPLFNEWPSFWASPLVSHIKSLKSVSTAWSFPLSFGSLLPVLSRSCPWLFYGILALSVYKTECPWEICSSSLHPVSVQETYSNHVTFFLSSHLSSPTSRPQILLTLSLSPLFFLLV